MRSSIYRETRSLTDSTSLRVRLDNDFCSSVYPDFDIKSSAYYFIIGSFNASVIDFDLLSNYGEALIFDTFCYRFQGMRYEVLDCVSS